MTNSKLKHGSSSKLSALLASSLLLLSAPLTYAGVVFTVNEVGPDVVVVGEGSYDLNKPRIFRACQAAFLQPMNGLAVGPDDEDDICGGGIGGVNGLELVHAYAFSGSFSQGFGMGPFTIATGATGDVFGFDTSTGFVTVPDDYVSGAPLAGTATYLGNFASLGITPGIYKYKIPGDTLTVIIGSIEQIVPCDGQWKNHGDYVSTYTSALNDLVRAGLMTEKEKGMRVKAAAQSDCGR